MNLDPKDIPGKESLREVINDIETNFDVLVPLREKYTAEEIIEYVVNHKYFKTDSWSNLNTSTLDGEGLKFCNAIQSLLVTWDIIAIESFKRLLSFNPGGFALEYLASLLHDCSSNDFPSETLLNFLKQVESEYPTLDHYFKRMRTIEKLEYLIKHSRPARPWKKATPAEELRAKRQ